MSLFALKKLGLASAVAVGGSYTGAILYGSKNSDAQEFIESYFPGFTQLQTIRSNISDYFRDWPLLKGSPLSHKKDVPKTPSSISPASVNIQNGTIVVDNDVMKEILDRYSTEQETWRTKLSKEREVDLESHSWEEERARAIAQVRAELEVEFAKELERALDVEKGIRIKQEADISQQLDQIKAETRLMVENFIRYVASDFFSELIDSVAIVTEQGALDTQNIERCVMFISNQSDDEVTNALCKSMMLTLGRTQNKRLELRALRGEFRNLAHLMKDEPINTVLEAFGISRLFRRILTRNSTATATEKIQAIEDAMRDGHWDEALILANSVSGWPRLVLKQWLTDLRCFQELQQGLGALRHHFISIRSSIRSNGLPSI